MTRKQTATEPTRTRPFLGLWQDFRYACRTLSRSKSFVVLSTVMLALGIGANTAIFSVVLTVLIRPLPYADADRVVWLSNRNPPLGVTGAFLNPADILDFREQSQSFERIAAWGTLPVNLYGARSPERVESIYVTPNFFRTLGVRPQLGRDFAEVNEPENSVIISHRLWLQQFGGDQNVIGKKITFGLKPGEDINVVIGVLPAETNFPPRVDLFTMTEIKHEPDERGGSHNWRTIGRLKPGVTIEQAQAEIDTLTQREEEIYPDTNKGWQVQIQSLRSYLFGNSRAALLLLFGAVAIVLMIACANVANLQLGRTYTRRRELALRLALGAGRFRIVRQFLIENLLLSFLGGGLGVFVAAVCLSVVRTMGPESIPRLTESQLSVPAFCFAFAISGLSTIMFGLFPAFQASQFRLNDALKDSHTAGTTPRRSNRLRRTLVVVQIALALILLTGAGLVGKSFWRLEAVDPGMKSEHLLTAGLSVSFADYPNGNPKRTQLFTQALETLSNLPGVVFNVRPFDQFMADAVAPRRFNLWLFSAFGLLATVLAAAGIYATMNFAVVQQRREIGIRVALGAQKGAVMKLILGEGALLVSAGLVLGFAASLGLNQLLKSLLFGVSATDPSIYLLMATLVIVITLVASSIPARRATRIDPIRTLRSE